MDINDAYSEFIENFRFNMNSIKDILDNGIKHTKDNYLNDELEKEIVDGIKKKFPNKNPQGIIWDYLESFKELVKIIGIYNKYKDKVIFMGHKEYKENSDKINQYKLENKKVLVSSSLYISLDKERINSLKLNNGYNMAYVYMHAVFDAFILDTIRIIMMTCPSSLKSRSTMTYDEIISYNDYDSIINAIVDREVEILSRGSYQEKLDYLMNRGLELDIDDFKWKDNMVVFYEIRNMLIHNKGVISKSFIEKVKKTKYGEKMKKYINSQIEITENFLTDQYKQIIEVAESLYRSVCNKFIYK